MYNPLYFGSMMVVNGDADSLITGATKNYPQSVKPVLRAVGTYQNKKAIGVYILIYKNRVLFLSDCTMQLNPTAEDLAQMSISTRNLYRHLIGGEPKVAFLSFSNFGSNNHPSARKMKNAVDIVNQLEPQMQVEGEMQADVAVNHNIMQKLFSFSRIEGSADILIFPDLNSANISYKLLAQLSDVQAIGPVLYPLNKAVNIVQRTSTVNEIVNMANLTALLAKKIRARM